MCVVRLARELKPSWYMPAAYLTYKSFLGAIRQIRICSPG